MFIGEAPGEVNDLLGKPFVGHGGRIFDNILRALGIDRASVFVTNVIKCRPPENRRPTKNEILACRRHLLAELATVRPRLVIAFGLTAFNTLTGERSSLINVAGIPVQVDGFTIVATYHPNALRYVKGGKMKILSDIKSGLDKVGISISAQAVSAQLDFHDFPA